MKILVINGPNMNMLGKREPEIYGYETLDKMNQGLKEFAKLLASDIELDFFQSNTEGEIVTKIQNASEYNALIINPAAYTHTSIAIADAIRAVGIKTVEVHLSNIQAREDYRKISYISPVAIGVITGFGVDGYKMAIMGLYNTLSAIKQK